MPFYEYQCKSCGHELEAMQKFSDEPLKKCPHCGKSQLQRLMSAPVFRLKGSGWYETDFKEDKDKKKNLADPSADQSNDKESKAEKDSKPETPAPSAAAKETDNSKKPSEKAPKPSVGSDKKRKAKSPQAAKKKSAKNRKR